MRKKTTIYVKLDRPRDPYAASLSKKRGAGTHKNRKKALNKNQCKQSIDEDE